MADSTNPSGVVMDLAGIKPLAEGTGHAITVFVDGIASFLGKICLPGAEEFGLLWKDKIANWRVLNAAKIVDAAKKKLEEQNVDMDNTKGHPRIIGKIIDAGSWADTIELQDLWAGLLTSSCTEDGKDESNLIFADLLGQLTSLQALVLAYSCEKTPKFISRNGLLLPLNLFLEMREVKTLCHCDDVHRIDRELDHLRSLGLLMSGLDTQGEYGNLAATPLALQLYMRCKGSTGDLISFYRASMMDTPNAPQPTGKPESP
jgi:hypothetical protein